MDVTIKGIDYILKYSVRAFFTFESLTGRQYEASTLMDSYLLFYAFLLANNAETFKLTYEEFIDVCDQDPTLFPSFLEFFNREIQLLEQLKEGKEKKGEKKGKGLKKK